MTGLTAADFEAGLVEHERLVAEADARAATAGSAGEREAARAEALVARRRLIRARAIDLLGRGLIPGLALVERLDCWLRDRAEDLGPEALDALPRAFNLSHL